MATTYWYTGSRWRDYIFLVNGSGTPISGEAGNFVFGVIGAAGDVGTTGISVSEPDDVNHPGVYEVIADPVTSFVALNGQYLITAINATQSQSFVQTLLVTDTVAPSVFIPGSAFIAAVADGRVTDGTDPLEGAVVTIVDSTNAVAYQAQTDSSGLWAAILEDGTYTVTVNLSGYARISSALTMTGGAGTLGGDLVMTATSTTALLASQLLSYTRRQAGDPVGTKAAAQIEESVNAALKMVSRDLSDHPWWEEDGYITLHSAYDTGSVSVDAGGTAITLADGTWPAWAASAEIYIDGTWYPVSTRDSATELTISKAYPGSAAIVAATYQLAQVAYAMPEDLHQVGTTVFYDGVWPYGAEPTDYESIMRGKHNRWQTADYRWASHNNTFAVWPPAPEDALAHFLYRRAPAVVSFSAPTAVVDVDPLLLDVVEAAIDIHLKRRGLFVGAEDPRVGYEAALRSSRTAAAKRPSTPSGMGGRGRMMEPRLSRSRRM